MQRGSDRGGSWGQWRAGRAVTDRADTLFDRAGPARAPSDPRAGAPARENGVNPAVHQDGELDGAPARENGG